MTELERFMKFVIPEPNSGCWLWAGATYSRGYGQFWASPERGNVRSHRWIYEQAVGPVIAGLFVCHKCDVPSCVNPAHLFLGTNSDNVQDCIRKGREKGAGNRPVKKHCPVGHEYTEKNTFMDYRKGRRRPSIRCRACMATRARKYYWAAKGVGVSPEVKP